jgi:antitoxin component of MazEF toxin-antitoxin module
MTHHRRLFKSGHSAAVTLPPEALDHLHLRFGDFVLVDASFPDVIVLTRSPGPSIVTAVRTVQSQISQPLDPPIDG